ncbi:MAG: sialate O-acetylesterase [Verrucomicrobia bacterium]|nr:MAG: sialate O-acetylesterase [Verrucomicrobiota bacterium]
MILQRDAAVPVWGWANPGEEVAIEFAGQKKTAKTERDGKWMAKLDPLPASAEPRDLKVGARVIRDVLVGDVWLCSGQSNMGFSVRDAVNGEREAAEAKFPNIRLFSVPGNPTLEPAAEVKAQWEACSPQTVAQFSGAAYFFGRELYRELNVPIGLLHSSVGGTPAEAWTRLEAVKTVPELAGRAQEEIAQIQSQVEDNKNFIPRRDAWEEKHGVKPTRLSEAVRGWAAPDLDASDWRTVTLPGRWAQFGAKSGGVFWLRKQVTLPESAAGKPFSLSLNWVSEQYDTAYFNGKEVGHASDQAPSFYNVQRSYKVPGDLVKAGRNVIAVRIASATQHAGMWQWGNSLGVPVAVRGSVDDQWQLQTESTFEPLSADALQSRPKVNNLPFRNVSAALYNGMIAPLIPFAIKGAIWYQGESNAPRHREYRELLSLMIRDWREQWGQGDFPFLLQQLVNNGAPVKEPNKTGAWPFLREAQMQVAQALPNSGIAIGIELGDPLTIHPANKQDVGKRLALVALEKVYAKPVESSGPRFEAMQIEGSTLRVKFTHARGLAAKSGPPKNFAIAGADKNFVWAEAKVEGETVVLSSPQVPQPAAVRYAWADNPDGCNLYNALGLPAAPFRTDEW